MDEERQRFRDDVDLNGGIEDDGEEASCCPGVRVGLVSMVHVLSISLIVLTLVTFAPMGLSWGSFALHPVAMLCGFTVACEGLVWFKGSPCMPRVLRKVSHSFFHLVALTLFIVGILAHRKTKGVDAPFWFSLHSLIGLLSTAFFALQFLLGAILFWFPVPGAVKARFLKTHKPAGVGILMGGFLVAASMGIQQWAKASCTSDTGRTLCWEANSIVLLMIFLAATTVAVVIGEDASVTPSKDKGKEESEMEMQRLELS